MASAAPSPCLVGKERNENGSCVDCLPDYFSSNGLKCKRCTPCKDSHNVVRDCTTTKNRICLCPDGEFWYFNRCKKCTECHPGYYQQRDCKHNRDRICIACPPGEHTKESNAKKCFPRPRPPVTPPTTKTIKNDKTILRDIVISLSLAIIIIAIVGAIIYYIRKRRKRRYQHAAHRAGDEEISLQDLPNTSFASEEYLERLILDNGQENLCYVRDLPAHLFEALALKLNPERQYNWVSLAGRLGYSIDRIGIFKLNPANATQNLLSDWATTDQSTVVNLFNHLIMIQREDAAIIVEQYVYVYNT